MLRTLRIRNLAILEDVSVEFGDGLNLLTGETGAGKSILVEALDLVAGARGDRSLVRAGAERAVVEALFEVAADAAARGWAAERDLGELVAGGELVVRREVTAGGGRVWLNGSPCALALLAEVGPLLLELHGQHEFRSLLSPERHLELLDQFAGHEDARGRVAEAHGEVVRRRRRHAELGAAAVRRAERAERLRELVRDVDAVAPRQGELDEIDRERRLLRSAAAVSGWLDEIVGRLYDDEPSAAALLAAAARRAQELAAADAGVEPVAARLAAAALEVQDLGAIFRDYRGRCDFRPERLEGLEARRAALERLLARHGRSEDEVVAARDAARAELAELAEIDTDLARAAAAVAAAEAQYVGAAAVLRASRQTAAATLSRAAEAQLRQVALAHARFDVRFADANGEIADAGEARLPLTPRGADRVEFLLAANPGEPTGPLQRVASGGELSRVMLALHAAAEAGSGERRVLVFDEVDAGIGGAVADAVGARLQRLGRRHQVLCVTHLPQVAAYADRHFAVRKRVTAGRTRTAVESLEGSARVEELARMLAGRSPTPASRRHAAELLGAAARPRSGVRRVAERLEGGRP